MSLYPQQEKLVHDIYGAWRSGLRNVLYYLPTGGGKTRVFSHIVKHEAGLSAVIAHREELVLQASLNLARDEVPHRVIGPSSLAREVTRQHVREYGRSWYNPQARAAVASVDSLKPGNKALAAWAAQVDLWVNDEAHHVTRDNKWGRAVGMFTNARGLGPSATPRRHDGLGLGRHADGVFDALVEGPDMRWHIDNGYLTDYDLIAPTASIDRARLRLGASGDYTQDSLATESKRQRAQITGDALTHWCKFAYGRQTIIFTTDIDTAEAVADSFSRSGSPALALSSRDSPDARREGLAKFRAGVIKVLVNVDLFGEGFDLPAVECVIFARPTMSFSLYCQQFGRALRTMPGKLRAIIIDMVGNCLLPHLGLPDRPQIWTLDRAERMGRGATPLDVIPSTRCLNAKCFRIYERVLPKCPYCGTEPPLPTGRAGPEIVDGDMRLVDAEIILTLRGRVAEVDRDPVQAGAKWAKHLPPQAVARNVRLHTERQEAQATLRDAIAAWAGVHVARGASEGEVYRRFFYATGVDILHAQTLGPADAEKIRTKLLTG